MVDLAPYWLLVRHRVTDKHFSLAAFLHFRRNSGDGDSICHCADAISTTTGHCAATRVANLSSGLILPPCIRSGTPHGINGNICWEAKIEVDGTFVQAGKYRKRRGEWELVAWETAVPSRLEVKLPSDFQQQVETARATHHRFGQYSRALDQIRLRLEYRAIEKTELGANMFCSASTR